MLRGLWFLLRPWWVGQAYDSMFGAWQHYIPHTEQGLVKCGSLRRNCSLNTKYHMMRVAVQESDICGAWSVADSCKNSPDPGPPPDSGPDTMPWVTASRARWLVLRLLGNLLQSTESTSVKEWKNQGLTDWHCISVPLAKYGTVGTSMCTEHIEHIVHPVPPWVLNQDQ